jgi:hypothetical protein
VESQAKVCRACGLARSSFRIVFNVPELDGRCIERFGHDPPMQGA